MSDFISEAIVKRLHPPSLKLWRDKQVSLLWSLVKMSRLHCITPWQGRKPSVLSEERLSPREEKTYGDLRHFFGQKNGGWNFYLSPAILKGF
jgi:hypothetical protein